MIPKHSYEHLGAIKSSQLDLQLYALKETRHDNKGKLKAPSGEAHVLDFVKVTTDSF